MRTKPIKMKTFLLLLVLPFGFLLVLGDHQVPSVDFKSDKSEIEFGKSVIEPKSGDFNSDDNEDIFYDEDVFYDENTTNSPENTERFPNDVFLSLRNITSETSFRSLVNGLDSNENENETFENVTSVNLRTLRDARPRADVQDLQDLHDLQELQDVQPAQEDSGIQLFVVMSQLKYFS